MRLLVPFLFVTAAGLAACASSARTAPAPVPAPRSALNAAANGTIASIIYWRAKPGRFDEYTRYVRDVAEPIDAEAQRNGAFLSVTTYMTRDTTSAWTHMRIFVLRDSTQLRGMSAIIDAATQRLEPDSVKRRLRAEYAVTLRESAGRATVEILR